MVCLTPLPKPNLIVNLPVVELTHNSQLIGQRTIVACVTCILGTPLTHATLMQLYYRVNNTITSSINKLSLKRL